MDLALPSYNVKGSGILERNYLLITIYSLCYTMLLNGVVTEMICGTRYVFAISAESTNGLGIGRKPVPVARALWKQHGMHCC